jgi:hypothetical protein
MEPGRAVLALGAVAGAESLEAVPLHDTGGALALAGAGHVDTVPASNTSAVISWPTS